MKDISILIPFRSDNGPREYAFQWVLKFYQKVLPDAEICIDGCDTHLFSKSQAVNNAAKKATGNTFVIADADMIYNPQCIELSIPLLKNAGWVIPYTQVLDLSKKSTQNLLATEPNWPINMKLEFTKRTPRTIGGLNIVSRKNFEAIGGWDERFVGWGGADDAFCFAMDTLCGKHKRLEMQMLHLWHEPLKAKGNPNYQSNYSIMKRYHKAYGNIRLMEQIIREKK
ncbi:MAG: galactosyltransferase-related protein [Bacillota bacterium]